MDEILKSIGSLKDKINDLVRPVSDAYVIHLNHIQTSHAKDELLLAQNFVIKSLHELLETELANKIEGYERSLQLIKAVEELINETKKTAFVSVLYNKPKDSSFSSN